MRKLVVLVFALGSALAFAQDASEQAPPPSIGLPDSGSMNTLTSLAGQFFNHDFVNFYGFADGIYDSTRQTLNTGGVGGGGSAGIDVGGGVQLSHQFKRSILSLNYRGDYRNYTNGFLGSGTNQYLNLVWAARLGQRWTLSTAASGGIMLYGENFYNPSGIGIANNPFSPETRFASASVFLSYQQSARLSYILGGSFFLNRYNYPGAIGSTGVIASGSVVYRTSFRTSVGATYSHDEFQFQHAAGSSHIDGVFGTLSHTFGRNYTASVSAGVTRAESAGIINIPVEVILPGIGPVTGYETGRYDVTRNIPTVQASLTHSFRKYLFSASGGKGVTPGNGTVLTSSNTYFGGVISRGFQRSNISGGVFYSHFTSIANQVSSSYNQTSLSGSYSYNLGRHISTSLTYSYFRYGGFLNYGGISDNRITFGFTFSSKNIPVTLF